MDSSAVTIGELAARAGVGVETVRYYQRRSLLEQPQRAAGYRRYGAATVARLQFIKRAQALGFTLDEISELLQLQDGTDRRSIRRIAGARLAQLRERIADMQRMAATLEELVERCTHAGHAPHCPIIESIAAPASMRNDAQQPALPGATGRPPRANGRGALLS